MRWFKHDSDANMDAKLRKVRIKYGMEGYGLYLYCLELIAGNVDSNNLTFELEHDSEIIATDTGIHYERVQEMMAYMIALGLFEQTGGVITCLKMAVRLDQSMTSNTFLRKQIHSIKNHDGIMTKSGTIMKEENRIEENIKKHTVDFINPLFEEFWNTYPKREGSNPKKPALLAFTAALKKEKEPKNIIIAAHAYRQACLGQTDRRFVAQAVTWLRQERWKDTQPTKPLNRDHLGAK